MQYLLDVLTNMSCNQVIFRFTNEDSSGLITSNEYSVEGEDLCNLPIESDGENESAEESKSYFRYVVMPMRI